MRKLKIAIATLCLVATLVIAAPMTARADDGGPQGTKNSAPKPPPPPPPDAMTLFLALLRIL